MTISELTQKVKNANNVRTRAQRVALLRKANIIDDNGYLSEKYFSKESVAKDRASGKPITL